MKSAANQPHKGGSRRRVQGVRTPPPARAVISSRQPAIIAGYSDENRRLLH